jgi:hypothetical protein
MNATLSRSIFQEIGRETWTMPGAGAMMLPAGSVSGRQQTLRQNIAKEAS